MMQLRASAQFTISSPRLHAFASEMIIHGVMGKSLEETVDALMADIATREEELLADKVSVNRLCRRLGRPEPYGGPETRNTESGQGSTRLLSRVAVHMDQFSGATSIREAVHAYLRWRGPEAGPQSFKTIFDMLTYGGFRFGGGEIQKRQDALRAALANDPSIRTVGDDRYAMVARKDVVASARARRRLTPEKARTIGDPEDTN